MKKQTIAVDELTERRHTIARLLNEDRQTAGGTLTDEARRWLERERKHYADGGDLDTWPAKRARILAIEADTAAAVAEKAKAEAAAKAEAVTVAAEIDARIKAKIAEDLDPVTQYKRAHSDRTF